MKNKIVSIFALLTFSTTIAIAAEEPCKPTKHANVPTITNFTYHKARSALLKAGWQPVQTKSHNMVSEDPDVSSGNGAEFWGKGYIEVESCSGTGVAACAFLFKDIYSNKLRVVTAGEEDSKLKAFALVSGFNFVCTPLVTPCESGAE